VDKGKTLSFAISNFAIEANKRNIKRFPERYRFQLTPKEMVELVAMLKHANAPSYVFTEEGVAQLSSVLRSDRAVEVSIMIMDAFVAMRRFLSANAGMFQRIERLEEHQYMTDQKVEQVLKWFSLYLNKTLSRMRDFFRTRIFGIERIYMNDHKKHERTQNFV